VKLSKEIAHQVYHVLRMRKGDRITLLDNSGWEYEAEIISLNEARILGKKLSEREPKVELRLFSSLLKGEKFEFVLQKGTELGVKEFIPVISSRCQAKEPGEEKLARWRKIVKEAAEQSGRGKLPIILPPAKFEEACFLAEGIPLITWEGEKGKGLKDVLPTSAKKVSLFVGPEGGYSAEEIETAVKTGLKPISLGGRILRAETAAIAALAAIMFHLGELSL